KRNNSVNLVILVGILGIRTVVRIVVMIVVVIRIVVLVGLITVVIVGVSIRIGVSIEVVEELENLEGREVLENNVEGKKRNNSVNLVILVGILGIRTVVRIVVMIVVVIRIVVLVGLITVVIVGVSIRIGVSIEVVEELENLEGRMSFGTFILDLIITYKIELIDEWRGIGLVGQLEIIKLKARVKRLERLNKVKSSKLGRLKKVGTSQRIESSEDEENVFNQGRISVDIDEGIELVDDQEKDAQEDSKVQEVVEVMNAAKLMTEVVTAATTQVVPAAKPTVVASSAAKPAAKPKVLKVVPTAPTVSTRKRKGVVIRDPEEELHDDTLAETRACDLVTSPVRLTTAEIDDDVAQPTSPLPPSPVIPPSPPHQSPRTSPLQAAEGSSILVQQILDKCSALVHRVEGLKSANTAQQLEIIKLKARVKRLERLNKVKSSKLGRLKKVGTSQRIESSEDEENVFNQGRISVDIDEGIEDRHVHHHLAVMVEREARMAREAWGLFMDTSDNAHSDVMLLRTMLVAQHVGNKMHKAFPLPGEKNPHQSVFDKKEINEMFPLDTLNVIKSSDGVFTARKPSIFLRLAIMGPPGDIMAQNTPPKRCLTIVSSGPQSIVMPMTWSNLVTLVNAREKYRKMMKCLKMPSKFARFSTFGASISWGHSRLHEGIYIYSWPSITCLNGLKRKRSPPATPELFGNS
nr:hypothetical protein [Tanacetum cinerariifolium]